MVRRIKNRAARVAAGGFGSLILFIGLGGLLAGAVTAIVFVVVGAIFAYRGRRSATVIVRNGGVELRGFAWSASSPTG